MNIFVDFFDLTLSRKILISYPSRAMPLASGVGRTPGFVRTSGRDRETSGSSCSDASSRPWRPWVDSRSPVSWDASASAKGGVQTDASPPCAKWRFGDKEFATDFDGGNLSNVERVTDTSYHLWTRSDNQDTPYETHHRTWFHFKADGFRKNEVVTFTFPDFNKQKNLFSNDFRPVYWVADTSEKESVNYSSKGTDDSSNTGYKRIPEQVTARKHKDGLFRVSWRHKFSDSGPTFFALTYPFGYHDCVGMLDRVDTRFDEVTDEGLELKKHIKYVRSTLTKSLEGRLVEMVSISSTETEDLGDTVEKLHLDVTLSTHSEAVSTHEDTQKKSVFQTPHTKKTFVVTCGVHPGEKPAFHLFCGVLEFLLRVDDPRAQKLRELYTFILVPMLNPDGVFKGHYRNDTLGQNLNRFYENPDVGKQPINYAVKDMLTQLCDENTLKFYIDLHAHANKRGVFAFGNACEGEGSVETRTFARLCALNSPHFDFAHCNFSEKNMQSRDKNGDSKTGTGRVALFLHSKGKLPHLYTIEANYNCSRLLNEVLETVDCDGNVVDVEGIYMGNQSDKKRKKYNRKYDPATLQSVGQAILVAVLDLSEQNPLSVVPSSNFRTVKGIRNWAKAAARGEGLGRGVVSARTVSMGSTESDEESEDEREGQPRTKKVTHLLAKTPVDFISSEHQSAVNRRSILSSDNSQMFWPDRKTLGLEKNAPKWRT